RTDRSFVSPDLAQALVGTGPPTYYLDFETIDPAIPLYPGTRPYEQVPLQWSLHRLDKHGALKHRDFLADGRSDPRRACALSLIDALGEGDAPVLAYSGF